MYEHELRMFEACGFDSKSSHLLAEHFYRHACAEAFANNSQGPAFDALRRAYKLILGGRCSRASTDFADACRVEAPKPEPSRNEAPTDYIVSSDRYTGSVRIKASDPEDAVLKYAADNGRACDAIIRCVGGSLWRLSNEGGRRYPVDLWVNKPGQNPKADADIVKVEWIDGAAVRRQKAFHKANGRYPSRGETLEQAMLDANIDRHGKIADVEFKLCRAYADLTGYTPGECLVTAVPQNQANCPEPNEAWLKVLQWAFGQGYQDGQVCFPDGVVWHIHAV